MGQRDFLARANNVIEKVAALSERARREGLLALEGEWDDNICKFAGMGLRMALDGYEADNIDKVLTNMLARETNEEERRIKAMWKDAVLMILAGNYTRILVIWLMSHLHEDESEVFRLGWDGELEYVEPKGANALPSVLKAAITRERKKELLAPVLFAQMLRDIVGPICDLSEKARSEGLAALESAFGQGDLDGALQKGLRLILDGAGSKELDEVFSDSLEQVRSVADQNFSDNDVRQKSIGVLQKLNEIRKEALLGIQAGENTAAIVTKIISRLDATELLCFLQDIQEGDLGADFFDDLGSEGAVLKKDFPQMFASVVRIMVAFSEKARREGLLALEDELGDMDDEFLKNGLRLVVDGTDGQVVDGIMSNGIRMEPDEDRCRLKTLIKEGVLSIQRGENTRILLHRLLSHADNSELKSYDALALDYFKLDCAPANADTRSFAERAAEILRRTCDHNEKARREGFLAIEDLVDEAKEARREIFDYGLRFVVNGSDWDTINDILSNIIARELDADIRRLKTMEKDALHGIQAGVNSAALMHALAAHMSDGELEKARGFFGEAEFDEAFWNLPEVAANEGQGLPRTAPEKSLGVLDLIDLINRALPFQAARRSDPARFADFTRRESPQNVAFTLACMTVATSGDGVPRVVEILNLMSRVSEVRILKALENSDPRLAEEIKKRMFVFEDIVLLSDRDIQKVMREVDSCELAKALKSVEFEVQEKIFRNMSMRAATMLKEDMEYMGPIRLKDVEESQYKIIQIIRYLEDAGEIFIARSGEDEIVV